MEEISINMLPKMSPVLPITSTQIVNFSSNDTNNSIEITAKDVIVNSSGGKQNHGSSKVKLKNIVDYNWEQRLYCGQLLAVHMEGNFLAYGIKVPSHGVAGTWSGMVRVAHRTSEKRALLKGMYGQVQDLCFAFVTTQVILAYIDEGGNIFIHNIDLQAEGIVCTLMLHVIGSKSPLGIDHRIVWCPYIPDDEDSEPDADEDASKLLVTTHGKKACIWNTKHIISTYGLGPHVFEDISEHCVVIEEHTESIIEAAFSPDGSALATASQDGFVMFFQQNFLQVYEHSDVLRCLFKWFPHDGKPLSCLFFLDSHVAYNTDQFWKYAVTGCDNNSTLKIWSCKSWVCLQTIKFAPSPDTSGMALKAGLDKSAEYLLLSDIHRKILFVLNLEAESFDNGVHCKSISEFFLPYPILSFGIVDAGLKAFKCPSSCSDPYHQAIVDNSDDTSPIDNNLPLEDNDGEGSIPGNGTIGAPTEGCNICAVIRFYLVQPKSLQEGTITFTPPTKSSKITSIFNTNINDSSGSNVAEMDTSVDKKTSMGSAEKAGSVKEESSNLVSVTSPLQSHNNTLAQQSQQLKNILMRVQVPSGGLLMKEPPSPLSSLLQPAPPLNLMTPDAFNSSPAKRDEEDPPIAVTPDPSAMDMDMQLCSTIDPSIVSSLQINPNTPIPSIHPQPDGKLASGGSSPSREVQEILSLKGSDCFYEDELEEDLNNPSPPLEARVSQPASATAPNNSSQTIREGFQLYAPPETETFPAQRIDHSTARNNSEQSSCSNDKTDTVWPSINMEKINEANQRKANSEKSNSIHKSNNSLNRSINLDENEDDGVICNDINKIHDSEIICNDVDRSESESNGNNLSHKQKDLIISEISKSLQELAAVINEQQKEILMLRGEVTALRHNQTNIMTSRNTSEENNSLRVIEQALQKNQTHIKQLVDTAIASRVDSDRSNREALLSGVSQIMGVQIAERLNSAVAHEARTALVPALERILEPVARSLQLELARTLSTTDHLLTENIQRLVNSKTVMDNLCLAVAQTLNSSTKDAFKEAIQTSLVPNMEKAQGQMFHQLNQTYNNGTKEYLATFEGCTKRTLDQFSGMDETCGHIKTMASQLQHILDQQTKQSIVNSQTQQTIKQLSNTTKDLQTMISKTLEGALHTHLSPIKECIREQISTGMAAHAAQLEDSVLSAVRSRTQTPAPSVMDMQSQQNQIEQLLASGQTNAAFQHALSASDLRLVVHACASADPRRVFRHPCPLQQHVLLSLIQQLGADMNSDTQLKHRYLEEAVMNLDNENPVTREHMPIVLKELQKQLSNFISNNPYNEGTRNLRVLMLATEALIRSGETGLAT